MKKWYAVQQEDDNDWGTGSYVYEEALSMLLSDDAYVRIAVIENAETDNAECTEEIQKSDILSEIKHYHVEYCSVEISQFKPEFKEYDNAESDKEEKRIAHEAFESNYSAQYDPFEIFEDLEKAKSAAIRHKEHRIIKGNGNMRFLDVCEPMIYAIDDDDEIICEVKYER